MSGDARRGTARVALDAIRVEITIRERELAAIIRAADVLERGLDADACDLAGGQIECAGEHYAAVCRGCGYVARRCTVHGEARAATTDLRHHQAQAHGSAYRDAAASGDTSGLRPGAEAMPVGELSASPADRDEQGGRVGAEHPSTPIVQRRRR